MRLKTIKPVLGSRIGSDAGLCLIKMKEKLTTLSLGKRMVFVISFWIYGSGFVASAAVSSERSSISSNPSLTRTLVEAIPLHRIIPGDRLDVKVAQDADLNTVALVDLAGMIRLQLIGNVAVGGLTTEEASEKVRLAYQKDYIIDPTISISIDTYGQQRFTVIGRVNRAGDFLFRANKSVNVLQAIAIAGGYSAEADPRKITVKRKVNGREEVYRLNGKEMAARQGVEVFAIKSGDIVTVGESLF